MAYEVATLPNGDIKMSDGTTKSKVQSPGTGFNLFDSIGKNTFTPTSSSFGNVLGGIQPENIQKASVKIDRNSQFKSMGFDDKDIAFIDYSKDKGVPAQEVFQFLQDKKQKPKEGHDLGFFGGTKELGTGIFRAGEQIPSMIGNGLGFVGNAIGTGLDHITPGLGKGAKDIGQNLQNIGNEVTMAGMTDGGSNPLTQKQIDMRKLGGQLALTAPVGGEFLAGATGLGSLALRSGVVGAGFGGVTPIMDKGNEATLGDIGKGAVLGGLTGAAFPIIGAGLMKGASGLGKYVSKTLPENLQVSGQFNPADLKNVSERLAKLTGKEIELEDAARWLLDRGIKGDLKTQRQQIQGIIKSEGENVDKILISKSGDIGGTKEANNLRKALAEKMNNYIDSDGIPTAGNEDLVSRFRTITGNPEMTLQEMNNGRRLLADGLFNKQGTAKELASKTGWQNVWKETSQFIEKKAPGFRTTNKNIEVGIAIDKAMLKKETAEQTGKMLAYLGLGGGFGGASGYAMGGDIESAVKGATVGFGIGQASRILNSPGVKSQLAYYLNKLSATARESIRNIQKGIDVSPENIGSIVAEMKALPPPSGKPLSVVNQKGIVISNPNGAIKLGMSDAEKIAISKSGLSNNQKNVRNNPPSDSVPSNITTDAKSAPSSTKDSSIASSGVSNDPIRTTTSATSIKSSNMDVSKNGVGQKIDLSIPTPTPQKSIIVPKEAKPLNPSQPLKSSVEKKWSELSNFKDYKDYLVSRHGNDISKYPESVFSEFPQSKKANPLYDWADKGYTSINKAYREGKTSIEGELVKRQMGKMPSYEGEVHRVTNLPKSELDNLKVGGTYSDKGFFSTSPDLEVAKVFHKWEETGRQVHFIVQSKTGKDISKYNSFPGEKEILYAPQSKFKITKIEDGNMSSGFQKTNIKTVFLQETSGSVAPQKLTLGKKSIIVPSEVTKLKGIDMGKNITPQSIKPNVDNKGGNMDISSVLKEYNGKSKDFRNSGISVKKLNVDGNIDDIVRSGKKLKEGWSYVEQKTLGVTKKTQGWYISEPINPLGNVGKVITAIRADGVGLKIILPKLYTSIEGTVARDFVENVIDRNPFIDTEMKGIISKPLSNAKQPLIKPTPSDTIPEGYTKNMFGEIIKKPSNKNGGFIRIGSEPKKLSNLPKELQGLAEEARKYKSAEEYLNKDIISYLDFQKSIGKEKDILESWHNKKVYKDIKIKISDIAPTWQQKTAMEDIKSGDKSFTKRPVTLIYRNGEIEIKDGRHRTAEAILRGDKYIDANMIDFSGNFPESFSKYYSPQ